MLLDIQQLGKPHAFSIAMFQEKGGSHQAGRFKRGGVSDMPDRQMRGTYFFFFPNWIYFIAIGGRRNRTRLCCLHIHAAGARKSVPKLQQWRNVWWIFETVSRSHWNCLKVEFPKIQTVVDSRSHTRVSGNVYFLKCIIKIKGVQGKNKLNINSLTPHFLPLFAEVALLAFCQLRFLVLMFKYWHRKSNHKWH